MIMFVTPIIKSGPEINAFAFNTVNCELETIISGVHVIIVKASITISVLVAVFLRTEIIIDAIVAVKCETQAVLVVVEILISGSNMIIFASKTIKSGREAIW